MAIIIFDLINESIDHQFILNIPSLIPSEFSFSNNHLFYKNSIRNRNHHEKHPDILMIFDDKLNKVAERIPNDSDHECVTSNYILISRRHDLQIKNLYKIEYYNHKFLKTNKSHIDAYHYCFDANENFLIYLYCDKKNNQPHFLLHNHTNIIRRFDSPTEYYNSFHYFPTIIFLLNDDYVSTIITTYSYNHLYFINI
jgi:hypothetical protein